MAKKIGLQFLLTFVLCAVAQMFLPWWVIAVISGIVAIFFNYRYGVLSFLNAFVAVGLLWLGYAFLQGGWGNASVLPSKMGELFGGIGGIGVILLTGLLGGLVAGLGALTGTMLKGIVAKK